MTTQPEQKNNGSARWGSFGVRWYTNSLAMQDVWRGGSRWPINAQDGWAIPGGATLARTGEG